MRGPTLLFLDTGMAGNGFTATEPDLKAYGIYPEWAKAVDGMGGGKCRTTGIVVGRFTIGAGPNEVRHVT